MDSTIYDFCHNELCCNISNYEIWNIPDVPDSLLAETPRDSEKIMGLVELTFEHLKDKIDSLFSKEI